MANWYYYNKNGEKVGPISTMALKELTNQGLIQRDTRIENGNGRSALAGKVNGLTFPAQLDTAPKMTIAPSDSGEVYGLTSPPPAPVSPPPLPVTEMPLPVPKAPVESSPFSLAPPVAPSPFTAHKGLAGQIDVEDIVKSFVEGFVEGANEKANTSMGNQAIAPDSSYAVADNPFIAPMPDTDYASMGTMPFDGEQTLSIDSLDFDGSEIADVDGAGEVASAIFEFVGELFG